MISVRHEPTHSLPHSMQQSPSSSEEIPRILLSAKDLHHDQNNTQHIPVLSYNNLVNAPPQSHFFKTRSIIIPHLLPSGLTTKTPNFLLPHTS